MRLEADVFGPGANFSRRFVENHEQLSEIVASLKKLGLKVALVLGTYDLTHIGHCRYLELAKSDGTVVIVAIDPDEAVKLRKGPSRPIVPQSERLEMLTHLRHVDLVTMTTDYDATGMGGYELIKAIHPDVFVMSEMNDYTDEQMQIIRAHSGEVKILPQQAETTTSAKMRLMTMNLVEEAKRRIEELANF